MSGRLLLSQLLEKFLHHPGALLFPYAAVDLGAKTVIFRKQVDDAAQRAAFVGPDLSSQGRNAAG